jgi:hypothetical protein
VEYKNLTLFPLIGDFIKVINNQGEESLRGLI